MISAQAVRLMMSLRFPAQQEAAVSNSCLPFPQDVLLLYYTQWCGFCPSLNHIFIQLARLLPEDTFTVAR